MSRKFKSLVLWLTEDCNLACKYCYAAPSRGKKYMDIETAKRAIELADQEGFSLQLAGGEPLMNFPLIKEIHSYLKEKDLKSQINMQTNGSLIDMKIAKELKRMGINVGVSLDGPIKINDFLRGKTAESIQGIKNLAKVGMMTNLNAVICQENIGYLDQLVELAFYLGNINGIGLNLMRKAGGYYYNQDNLNLVDPDDLDYYLRKAYKRSEELYALSSRRIHFRDIQEAEYRLSMGEVAKDYCYACLGQSAIVNSEGDIYPCASLVGWEEYYMGNVFEAEKIEYKSLELGDRARCRDCEYEKVCPGACPSRYILNSKDEDGLELDCRLRRTAFSLAKNKNNLHYCK